MQDVVDIIDQNKNDQIRKIFMNVIPQDDHLIIEAHLYL